MTAYFKIHKLPALGLLMKNGIPLQVGSKFTQSDINENRITYRHTAITGQNALDSFDFTLWDSELGAITTSSYGPCMPPRDIETPADGVFRFAISILNVPPINTVTPDTLELLETETLTLTMGIFNVVNAGFTPDQVIHTLRKPLSHGYITLRGKRSSTFTQADVNAGDVKYVNTHVGTGIERIEVTSCNLRSGCIDFDFTINILERFKITGDNVIYVKTGSRFVWEFTANRPSVLWSLSGGTEERPPYATERDLSIIGWSSYAMSSDQPYDSEGRGPGYDKLFRNVRETLYWDGGLPKGIYLSNIGYMTCSLRNPPSLAGSQHWTIPNTPGEYPFEMIAFDATTGQMDSRKYMLVATMSGFSGSGLSSESKDL